MKAVEVATDNKRLLSLAKKAWQTRDDRSQAGSPSQLDNT